MRKLNPINIDTLETVQACLSPQLRKIEAAKLIRDDLPQILMDEAALKHAIATDQSRFLALAELEEHIKPQMTWLYEHRLRTGDGLAIREEILALGEDGCAYCHNPNAKTLDHLYPKAIFPRLAVTPLNLVPACRDCNEDRSTGSGTVSVNPYFDHWADDDLWLSARLPDPSDPVDVRFAVVVPPSWSQQQVDTINDFVASTRFLMRCEIAASHEMRLRARRFSALATNGRIHEVLSFLRGELVDHVSRSKNYWGSVAYQLWVDRFDEVDWTFTNQPRTIRV